MYIPTFVLDAALVVVKDPYEIVFIRKLKNKRVAVIAQSNFITFIGKAPYSCLGEDLDFEYLAIPQYVIMEEVKNNPKRSSIALTYSTQHRTFMLGKTLFTPRRYKFPEYEGLIPTEEELCDTPQVPGGYDFDLLKLCADALSVFIGREKEKANIRVLQRGNKPAVVYSGLTDSALCLVEPTMEIDTIPKPDFDFT